MLPNTLCVGAQKAGTTSLAEVLKRHPHVFIPKQKELHFFELEENWRRGSDWYASHFADANEAKIRMELTPDYLPGRQTAKRIAEVCGHGLKIIIMMRHPVDRAYSQYNFYRWHGVERHRTFEEAIRSDHVRDVDLVTSWHEPPLYVLRSLYFEACSRYLDVFAPSNVLLLRFEDLKDSTTAQQLSDRVSGFLGIDKLASLQEVRANPTLAPSPGFKRFAFSLGRRLKDQVKLFLSEARYRAWREHVLGATVSRPAPLDPDLRERLFDELFFEDCEKLASLGVDYTA